MERVTERRKEPEPEEVPYDAQQRRDNELCQRRAGGVVVLKGKELVWRQSRQGLVKNYIWDGVWDKFGAPPWRVFLHEIRQHSGCHRHQGGLAILVVKGKGYTVVDGVRYDWEEGDCIQLPIRPGGVEHQHFNADPETPAVWLALIYTAMTDQVNVGITQVSEHPDWGAKGKK